jgi:hypothetical protein
MPIDLTTTTPTMPSAGQSSVSLGTLGDGIPITQILPIQIMGFVPLISCTATECRRNPLLFCCDDLPVFGNTSGVTAVATSTYENDFNTFMVDHTIYQNNPNSLIVITLEKCTGNGVWSTAATISDTTYGTFYPLNGFTTHKSYTGVTINWGKVYVGLGAGCYRIKFQTIIYIVNANGGGVPILTPVLAGCLVSQANFNLKLFNCNLAHRTTKFEMTKTGGTISDATLTDGSYFDLCNISYYDSIRVRGFFGERDYPEYLNVLHEYQNTKTTQIRNEVVPKYKWISELTPYFFTKRFPVYGCMSDQLLVSDYNINNSDYTIKQMFVRLDGAYKPKYNDKNWNNHQSVEAEFHLGYRGYVSSTCCTTVSAKGGT